MAWTDDQDRCAAAGVPEDVGFATKPQLAAHMIAATLAAGVPAGWVAADEVYGNDSAFRDRVAALGLGYVLAVACDHRVDIDGGKTRMRADEVAKRLPSRAWQRRPAGAGSKGPRYYDWAWLADVRPATGGGRHSLLIRRNTTTGQMAFYRCFSPRPATLAMLVAVAGIRWSVEESFQAGKSQVGLDQHQVRHWICWQRFTVLAIAALAVLAICAATTAPPPAADPYQQVLTDPEPQPWTVNEIRRLFNTFLISTARDATHRLSWSIWRSWHNTRARRAHYRRRQLAELVTR